MAVGEGFLVTVHGGEEGEISFLCDVEHFALVFLRVDGNVDGAAFVDVLAGHVVLAQNTELGAAVHLVRGFLYFVVGQ